MERRSATVRKLREWVGRYLPCEIAGTTGEFGGAAIAYLVTGSVTAAAVTATVGASAGYYAAAYTSALRSALAERAGTRRAIRVLMANALALRSVTVEFGPAELVDSVAVRPLAFFVGPALFGNVVLGWVFGKLLSDLAFYVITILSYERFKALLAGRQPHEETDDVSATTIAAG